MSRLIKAHPVERLVIAYLQRLAKTNKVRTETAILDKAAKMIGIVLHDPCCAPAEEVILGRKENFFIHQLQSLLNGVDERKWRESLERAKSLLEKALLGCCPLEVTVMFPFTGDDNMKVTFVGLNGQGTFTTDFHGGIVSDEAVLTMPAKGKYNVIFETSFTIPFGSLCLNEFGPGGNFGADLCRSGVAGQSIRPNVTLDAVYNIVESA